MLLRKLTVDRFRGIKQLDWNVGGALICLVGPGDSTKTTILDAIELALSPRWNVTFDDADFFGATTVDDIVITVVVGDLPKELESEAKYGLLVRGWSAINELHDEPQDGDELVLSIQLRVGASLEPSWAVVNDRRPDGKAIGAKDRESLGCARLGDYLDRHFAWGRGSALSRLTERGDNINSVLADANRAARAILGNLGGDDLPKLRAAADKVRDAGKEHGVAPKSEFRPNLDVKAISIGEGGLSLHDGDVPVRKAGLGTRRLLAIAMQREMTAMRSLSLIDEIEHGLEPHRIRNVLRVLQGPGGADDSGSVMMTTHAPVVLEELKADHLRVVRCVDGITSVIAVPIGLQPIVRKASGAFLARKVIICEGKTELGICRGLDYFWAKTGPSFGLTGVALAHGGGTEAAAVAMAFAQLGYDTALIGDSDKPLAPSEGELTAATVHVLLWDGGVVVEERVALDLPVAGVQQIVQLAIEHRGEAGVRDAIKSKLGAAGPVLECPPSAWPWSSADNELRKAIGLAANSGKWFKRVDLAEELAEIVVQHIGSIGATDLGVKTAALRVWAHGLG